MNKLIVFIKNPVLGKVKTRLAATIGDEKALKVYRELIDYTLRMTNNVNVEVNLFFSEEIISEYHSAKKHLQEGSDLGAKMKNAFEKCFLEGGKKVVIIGTDCAELTAEIIREAFDSLDKNEIVVGPALDGGYYLLGMNTFYPDVFSLDEWSTPDVFNKTKEIIQRLQLKMGTLQVLRDIDTEQDLFTFNLNK